MCTCPSARRSACTAISQLWPLARASTPLKSTTACRQALHLHSCGSCLLIAKGLPVVHAKYNKPSFVQGEGPENLLGAQAYVDLLVEELGATAQMTEHPLKTVFFGGGTPSLISPRQLDRVGVKDIDKMHGRQL